MAQCKGIMMYTAICPVKFVVKYIFFTNLFSFYCFSVFHMERDSYLHGVPHLFLVFLC